ncbi:MAG: transcription termination factor NusA [Prevotella sp.]|nr:transcription termination factor NusA [Prevotella sp.]
MMANKQDKGPSMIETFKDFKETKHIDRTTLVSVLEESFRSVIAKLFGSDENFDVIMNPDKGDCEIHRNRVVVPDGEVQDQNKEISLSEAQKIEPDYEVGEEVSEEVKFEKFGRRAILTLRQTLASKVLELENDALYQKYKEREGQLISAEVYQTWKREALLMDDEGNELHLPKQEQIPGDNYRKGETVKAVVLKVDNETGKPRIILSRAAPRFLECLLEQEVPEIADMLISVKAVARIPGDRAKVAVQSYDDRIDPVGACVGVKGSRVAGIVREMQGENIDVINYTSNEQIFIQRALSPAKVSSIKMLPDERKAEVYLEPSEVSLAIGKGGTNIKLASLLTKYTIDVFRVTSQTEEEEDIYLEEFADEIDMWVIEALKTIGLDTAKAVLGAPKEMLIEKADLEEETVDHVLQVLSAEFEQEQPGNVEANSSEAEAGNSEAEADGSEAEAGADSADTNTETDTTAQTPQQAE